MTTTYGPTDPLAMMATLPVGPQKKGTGAFYEAMARAWGATLDAQAARISEQSDVITGGNDTPAAVTELQTQSLKMSFLSQAASTSNTKVAEALETMARKG
jgi:hypothetical protein